MGLYAINTFISHQQSNTDKAISYYRQKTDALLGNIENKLMQQAQQFLSTNQSFSEIFEQVLQSINIQMSDLESFYNKKIKGSDLQSKIQSYNKNVQSIQDGLQNGFSTLQFLHYLKTGQASDFNSSSQLPQTINLSAQSKVLETMAAGGYVTASAAGGARARLVGEITEQIVLELVKGNLNNLFNTIKQAGSLQTQNFGGLTSGKSDVIFSTTNMDFTKLANAGDVGIIGGKTIELDLVEALDLEEQNSIVALEKYRSGERSLIGGMSIKQWSDKMLGKKDATFAHSTYTMNLINDRYPNHLISKGFRSRAVFSQYTAYIVSKFLINVIGVYNILVANSSGIELTSSWLEQLKNKHYALQHVIKMENSIWTAKDTIYVGKLNE